MTESSSDGNKSGGDGASTPEDVSPITKLFGVEQEQTSRCVKCGTENSKVSAVLLSSLMLHDVQSEQTSFEVVLERSFDLSSVTPAWCDTCQKYQPTQQRRRCLALPPLLALSCGNDTMPGFSFWSNQLHVKFIIAL